MNKSIEDIIKLKRDYRNSFEPIYNPEDVELGWNEWWKIREFYHVKTEDL